MKYSRPAKGKLVFLNKIVLWALPFSLSQQDIDHA